MESEDVGFGLFLTASLFNHSCMRNASFFAIPEGQKLMIIANNVIIPGEEICVQYRKHDIRDGLEERRKQMQFDCRCQGCQEGLEGQDMELALWCMTSLNMSIGKGGRLENAFLRRGKEAFAQGME